jgi:sarcosine oxidase subunit beta
MREVDMRMQADDAGRTADAVIIGGGSTGASTLYHLSRRGIRAVLVERTSLAAGGTGRSAAILRQHYADIGLALMAQRSIEIFQNFDRIVGGDPGYVKTGYVVLVGPSERQTLQTIVTQQRQHRINTDILPLPELHALDAAIRTEDIGAAAYEPDGGYADPVATTHAYASRARDLGASILTDTEAVGIVVDRGKVRGVRTNRGDISSPNVLNAAGPWAPAIARMVGADLPLRLGRQSVAVLEIPPQRRGRRPIYADKVCLVSFRPVGEASCLVGSGQPVDTSEPIGPDSDDTRADPGWATTAELQARHRFIGMERCVALRDYAGVYDLSPDWKFMIDAVPEAKGFFVACGFSGHGFKHCPVLGELIASMIIEGTAPPELRPFGLDRFRHEVTAEATHVYPGLPMV